MRHDNVRDFLIGLLQITQTDAQKEPLLQPIQTNVVQREIGNSTDEARLDIRARGFWKAGQDAYFDARVTNPLAATAMKMSLSATYGRHEQEKKRAYNHRVLGHDSRTGHIHATGFFCIRDGSTRVSGILKTSDIQN